MIPSFYPLTDYADNKHQDYRGYMINYNPDTNCFNFDNISSYRVKLQHFYLSSSSRCNADSIDMNVLTSKALFTEQLSKNNASFHNFESQTIAASRFGTCQE